MHAPCMKVCIRRLAGILVEDRTLEIKFSGQCNELLFMRFVWRA